MRLLSLSILIIIFIATFGCENNIGLKSSPERYIASEHLQKIDGNEDLVKSIKELLAEEQNSKTMLQSDSEFLPEKNPKFPLPYYLIPEEDSQFISSAALDERISDQLIMRISGKKHYKLFVHPEAESTYGQLLKSAYNYIGPLQTEFYASPISLANSLIIWNKNNNQRKAFIAKMNGKTKISSNEIERSIVNQRAFEKMGINKLESFILKTYPETAGIMVKKAHSLNSEVLASQLISEIPDDLYNNEKKWFSFLSMISTQKNPKPLILEIIKSSGLSSFDFIKTHLVDNYLNMFEEISLRNGMSFEVKSNSLILETTLDLRPTGKLALRNLNAISADILTMAKNKGPVEAFMDEAAVEKYKLNFSRISYLNNLVQFKQEIFTALCNEVAKHDSSLTVEKISTLGFLLEEKFLKIVNAHLSLSLTEMPNATDFKKIEVKLVEQLKLDESIVKKSIDMDENLAFYLENKKSKKEWIEVVSSSEKVKYFLTNHALYETSKGKITGMALFTIDEYFDYQKNNQMLPSLNYSSTSSEKKGYTNLFKDFLSK